ncbi:MAG: helix-turn-helix domain-containing protein [Oscillospiraceae bacterium]|nr:helix-turn-helix domain-containing protein [Oscillospiraceae bacterium]
MNDKIEFGRFITNQRQCHSMKSQELAEELGISVGYLSQLEHGQRTNPSPELLENLASVLHLNKQETETLYDLYAKANGSLSPDAAAYASSHPIVVQALRAARDADATDADWMKFIDWLKK